MEILSISGPDRSISDADLKSFHLVSKRYRNRRIGNFLKELQLVVRRNTGVPAIVETMKNNGSEPPCFETNGERSYFSVILPVHPSFRNVFVMQNAPASQPGKSSRKRRSAEEIRRLVIHQLEVEEPMSTRELARKLG